MEGEHDHVPATAQLTFLQVDLEAQPKNKLKGLIGKHVKPSEELEGDLEKISHYWPANDRPDPEHIHIIVQVPPGKRWVQWVSEILLTALLSVCHFTTSLLSPHLPTRRHQLLAGLPHLLSR
jgi:hypothetical protein